MAGKGTGVTVFVDDAVTGNLPAVCAKSGAPMEGLMTIRTELGAATRLGVLWLLVLAGPLGWLALVALYRVLSNGREMLTVQLPWTEGAKAKYDEAVTYRRTAVVGAAVLAVASVAALLYAEPDPRKWFAFAPAGFVAVVVLAVVAGATIAAINANSQVEETTVQVTLDASRRWVTLKDVHPNFAEAVEQSRRGRHTPMP
jgi:succinate dehydrogenase hydrophobic anchor subunit